MFFFCFRAKIESEKKSENLSGFVQTIVPWNEKHKLINQQAVIDHRPGDTRITFPIEKKRGEMPKIETV